MQQGESLELLQQLHLFGQSLRCVLADCRQVDSGCARKTFPAAQRKMEWHGYPSHSQPQETAGLTMTPHPTDTLTFNAKRDTQVDPMHCSHVVMHAMHNRTPVRALLSSVRPGVNDPGIDAGCGLLLRCDGCDGCDGCELARVRSRDVSHSGWQWCAHLALVGTLARLPARCLQPAPVLVTTLGWPQRAGPAVITARDRVAASMLAGDRLGSPSNTSYSHGSFTTIRILSWKHYAAHDLYGLLAARHGVSPQAQGMSTIREIAV